MRQTWLACWTIGVLVLAPALGWVHRATVPHALCEHGDWIEPPEGVAADPPMAAELSGDRGDTLARDTSPPAHGHSHCTVGVPAQTGAAFVSSARISLRGGGALGASCPPSVAPLVRPVLESAPKTSPPV